MKRSLKSVIGVALETVDARFGVCSDVLFDENSGKVSYLVVDNRKWFPGKRVVLARRAVRRIGDDVVELGIGREVVWRCPPYPLDHSLLHAGAARLIDGYGLFSQWLTPNYLNPAVAQAGGCDASAVQASSPGGDYLDLLSCKQICGYKVLNGGTAIGQLSDIRFDDSTWRLLEMVISSRSGDDLESISLPIERFLQADHDGRSIRLSCLSN